MKTGYGKEVDEMLALIMEYAGDLISSRICEDMPQEAYDLPTPEQRTALQRDYHNWNGDPHEIASELNPDGTTYYFMPNAGPWLEFFADKLRSK